MAGESRLAAGSDEAREAAELEAGAAAVGEHLDFVPEADGIGSHLFACELPGYRGWRWSVTMSQVLDTAPTVDEVVLLPGPESLLSPPWVPWSERVKPGDLGVGDVLPASSDDPRLVPGFTNLDDLEGLAGQSPLAPGQWELGLGRERILSELGRADAAERWAEGEFGPDSPMAKAAAAHCSTCGFMLSIGGPLGQQFGICANIFGAADGRVVSLDYGCGAHSQVAVEPAAEKLEASVDELGWDPVDQPQA